MPRALDLFCGGGGAARGLVAAGFEVVGVDLYESPAYPGEVLVRDAAELGPADLEGFDLVWASPPCQRYSVATPTSVREDHVDLLGPIQDLLDRVDVPSIVENVPGAPMRRPAGGLVVSLTGPAVGLDLIERRRLFACRGFLPMVPPARRARRINGAVSLATKGQFRKVRLEDGSRRTEVPKARAVKSGAVALDTSGPKSNRQKDRPGAMAVEVLKQGPRLSWREGEKVVRGVAGAAAPLSVVTGGCLATDGKGGSEGGFGAVLVGTHGTRIATGERGAGAAQAVTLGSHGPRRRVSKEDGSHTSGPVVALADGEVWVVDRSLKGEGVLRGKALMRACLGIEDDAMSQKELGEAIPPAYAELLARQALGS